MRRGFTLMEMAICLSILLLLVPLVFLYVRSLETQHDLGAWQVEVAEQARTVSEALRADVRGATWAAEGMLSLVGEGPCGAVTWARTPAGVFERRASEACGGTQAMATHVTAARRVPGGLELTFGYAVRPDAIVSQVIFLPVGG